MSNQDDSHGFDKAPDRYMAYGRETVDRMRDEAYQRATYILGENADQHQVTVLGNSFFAYACETHMMKYMDRAGLKEGESRESDLKKAMWWALMALSISPDFKDPRSDRPGFVPYSRQRVT